MKLARPAAASIGLSALFVTVYSSCNYLTSLRANVPSLYFSWERYIPFVPPLILPYMSIDLFFIAAPFLMSNRQELRVFVRRIAAAILLAGVCFLIFPLRFAFTRPPVDGPLGIIFNNFRSLDLPFNEFPSLHITLWCLLLTVYLRHTRGLIRVLLIVWFALIAASTALTFQHHISDILGGFALALLCIYLFPEQSDSPKGAKSQGWTPNKRIALYYAILAALCTASALARPPFTLILLWPALAAALMACAYLWVGPAIYRKSAGQIPFSAGIILWPVRVGQYLSLLHYARQCRAYDPLLPNLLIGRRLTAAEARTAPIHAVLDLTSEFTEPHPLRKRPYLCLPTLDLTAPTPAQITQALAFIHQHAATGTVYIHCKAGYSRTAVIAGAYLFATGAAASPEDALAMLRRTRPQMVIRPEAIHALQNFARNLQPSSPALTSPEPASAPATV